MTAIISVRAKLGMGIAMAAIAATQASAQSTAPEAADADHSYDIVVTASKRAEPLQQVPSAVSAISGQALESVGASRLSEILNSTPGVTLKPTGYPGRNTLVLRGINSGDSQAGSSIGVYIDDTPVGSSTVFSVGALLTPDIDPYDLERVEVLRGPQGTLYGANTLGGLLKFVTKGPDLDAFSGGGRAQLSATKGDESYLVGGRLNVPLVAGKLAVRASASYRRDAGWVNNAARGTKNVNDARTTSGRIATLFQATEKLSIKLNYLYQNIEADSAGYVQIDATGRQIDGDLTQRPLIDEPTKSRFHIVSGTASYELGGLTMSSITSYAYSRNFYRRDQSPDLQPLLRITDPIGFDGTATTKKFTEEFRLSSDASKPLSFIAGLFYTHEDSGYLQAAGVTNADGTFSATSPFARLVRNNQLSIYKEYAAFGNLTYVFSPMFDVTLGLRYSKNEQDVQFRRSGNLGNPSNPSATSVVNNHSSDEVTTYLANARLHLDRDKMLYVRVASGYRPGGPRNFPPVPIPPGLATQFLPDTVWNYEAGLKTQWANGAVTVNLAAFRIDWKDIQLTQFIPPFNLLSNGGRARSEGVELETVLRPARGFVIRYNASYTDARLLDGSTALNARAGDPIPYVPKWAIGVDASYTFPVADDWDANLGVAYQTQDKRVSSFGLNVQRITLPSYDTIDLRAGLTSSNGFEVNIFVRNLRDTRGLLNSEAFGSSFRAIITQPRTFGIGISKSI